MARGMCRKDSIGAGGENEDVIGDCTSRRGLYGLCIGIDLGDTGVEMVIKCSLFERPILVDIRIGQFLRGLSSTHPFLGIQVKILDLAVFKE